MLYNLGEARTSADVLRTAVAQYEALTADFPAVPDYRRGLGSAHVLLGYTYWDETVNAAYRLFLQAAD